MRFIKQYHDVNHYFILTFLFALSLILSTRVFSAEIFLSSGKGGVEGLEKQSAESEKNHRAFEFSLSVGQRQDNLNWNEANETGSVNIVSELKWENIKSIQLGAAATVNFFDSWSLRGKADIGRIYSGSNQDSDYNGNNRTLEISRSNNNSSIGTVRDASVALGSTFHFPVEEGKILLSLTPLAGLALHQQDLTITDGVQTIPATGAFARLHNTYNAQWAGQWLGLEGRILWGKTWRFNATAEFHRADYLALASWNLRTNFAQPISFVHNATGTGVALAAAASYLIDQDWQLSFALETQRWKTGAGVDRTFFTDGSVVAYRINGVFWDSSVVKVGLAYRF